MIHTSEERQATRRINEHVEHCQICTNGQFCDILERLLDEIDAEKEQVRQAEQERRLRQAGL